MVSGSTSVKKAAVTKKVQTASATKKREAGKIPLELSARLSSLAEMFFEGEVNELEFLFGIKVEHDAPRYASAYSSNAKAKRDGMMMIQAMAKMMALAINSTGRNTKDESDLAKDLLKNVRSRMRDRELVARNVDDVIADSGVGESDE